MVPKLELAFTFRGYVSKEDNVNVGAIKGGPLRRIFPVTHGFIKGSGLDTKVLQGGSDWSLVDLESNVTYLDVRTQARSADGESIYLSYHGFLKIDEAVTKAMSWDKDAATTKSGDHEWFSAPRFETSIKALKWIETTMFVGQGHCVVEGDQLAAEYDIYKVIN